VVSARFSWAIVGVDILGVHVCSLTKVGLCSNVVDLFVASGCIENRRKEP